MSEGMANNQQNMFQMSMEEQVRMQQMTAPGEGEKKRGIGSRIGYFFLTIVPPVVSMILQLVAVLLVVFVGALIAGATGKIDVTNQINMMIQIQELVFNSAPLGIMLYHIIGILVFGLWFRACYKKPRPTIKGSFEKVNGKGLSTNDLTDDLKANYDSAYEHSQSAHAPSNAQKNSDITKAEIEAKLTGNITTHTHSQYLTSIPSEYITEQELTSKGYATATTHEEVKTTVNQILGGAYIE